MDRANVLILPGLLEDADAFEAVIEGLKDVATCVVADLSRANTIAGLAKEALKQAPWEKFLLAGHSMGGYVALEVMRQAPQRVTALALMNDEQVATVRNFLHDGGIQAEERRREKTPTSLPARAA